MLRLLQNISSEKSEKKEDYYHIIEIFNLAIILAFNT